MFQVGSNQQNDKGRAVGFPNLFQEKITSKVKALLKKAGGGNRSHFEPAETPAKHPAKSDSGVTVELLDEAPLELSKPLSLIDGRAYAAVFAPVKITVHHTTDEKGKITEYNPPRETIEKRLLIVCDDGVVFGGGDEATKPLKELGLEVRLRTDNGIDPRKLFSVPGLKRFRSGERPNPVELFERVKQTIDRFIDFEHSLSDQATMCELIACYIFTTWFMSAFNVTGFIWSNALAGSGKTKLLDLISKLSYLGELILSSSTFATLRDSADYGGTLCFDDAEAVADVPKTPDAASKRELLLAGNRRGASVLVNEFRPEAKKWERRRLDAFCPRAFSAINVPDGVLASRSIIVRMVRSGNQEKANADVNDYEVWPHNHRQLIDDLWAVALANLSRLSDFESKVKNAARLIGRALEPWRAILAVAMWLDAEGVSALYERMLAVAEKYQGEREVLETLDLPRLVILSLVRYGSTVSSTETNLTNLNQPNQLTNKGWLINSHEFLNLVSKIALEKEVAIAPTPQGIGMVLQKLGLKKIERSELKQWGKKDEKRRFWLVTEQDLHRLAKTHNLSTEELTPSSPQEVGQVDQVGLVGSPDPAQTPSMEKAMTMPH